MESSIKGIREILPRYSSHLQVSKEFDLEILARVPPGYIKEQTAREFGQMLGNHMFDYASKLHFAGFKSTHSSNLPGHYERVTVDVVAVNPDLWSKIVVLLRELDTDET